jgi:phosphoglycerol geranylgeranyltransferase
VSLPRTLYTAVDAVHVLGQELFGDVTNPIPSSWTHVTKVDPEPAKRLPLLYPAYLAHTDAVSVGGSRGVTATHTEATFDALAVAPVPAFHEPSDAAHVTAETRARAAFLALPEVLNGDADSLVGELGAGVATLHDELVPDQLRDTLSVPDRLRDALPDAVVDHVGDRLADVLTSWLVRSAVSEAYIVQNPDSAAAREAGVGEADVLSPAAARERALAAEHRLDSEVVYLEYSGTFGGERATETLGELAEATQWARVWYGGGVRSAEAARAVLDAGADTVVVGDVFHDVAAEERRLIAAYREAVGDPEPDAIRAWLANRDEASDTTAAAYLSTIPSVADPADRATTYLTATIACRLWLDHERSQSDDEETSRPAVGTEPAPPWETTVLDGVLTNGGETFLRRCRAAAVDPTTELDRALAHSLGFGCEEPSLDTERDD